VCGWAWPALIEPLLEMLGEAGPTDPHRVVLIPGDSLGYVPWHAARSSDGTRVACETFAFSYAASARQLAAVAGRARTGPGARSPWSPTRPTPRITACLMVRFHLYRAGGLDDRDALRAAQLWMLDPDRAVPPAVAALLPRDPAVLAEPSSWAPFAHHGR
jgi:hypothetical protein